MNGGAEPPMNALGIPLPDDGGGFLNGTSEVELGRCAASLSPSAWRTSGAA